MGNSSLHILIVWSTAKDKSVEIINDVKSHFIVKCIFHVHWDPEKFFDNYRVFYSHSLKHLNYQQFSSVINNKIQHCGTGDFLAIIFEDPSPNMQLRETSSGKRLVNANVFDKKLEYRTLTGGGHRIHSSDDAWETNKDLTLLFGLNSDDFCEKYEGSNQKEIEISKNCIGVGGYDSISQLFYALNNTIRYCVLRNHECLPDEYTEEGHGDIDLLVEDKNYMFYLTLAKQVFPNSYRVYHTIKIFGREVPFDFRYIGDNYYDQSWEKQILEHRQLKKGIYYSPDDEDQFYSLLYHAYIQKYKVKSDYLPKLKEYGERICVSFKPDISSVLALLDDYMESKSFEYIRPTDLSVVYNRQNLENSRYALRYGDLVKRVDMNGENGFVYTSLVYKKNDNYIKRGTTWLIDNEARFLKKVGNYHPFPYLLNYKKEEKESIIEITKIEGLDFHSFFENNSHQRKRIIKSFLSGTLEILKILNKNGICHRDFLPANIIISEENGKSKVGLIDFGWAVYLHDDKIRTPLGLGKYYRADEPYSDLYSFGRVLLEMWYEIPYIRNFASILLVKNSDVNSQEKQLALAEKYIHSHPFSLYDEVRLIIRRHIVTWEKMKNLIKIDI